MSNESNPRLERLEAIADGMPADHDWAQYGADDRVSVRNTPDPYRAQEMYAAALERRSRRPRGTRTTPVLPSRLARRRSLLYAARRAEIAQIMENDRNADAKADLYADRAADYREMGM